MSSQSDLNSRKSVLFTERPSIAISNLDKSNSERSNMNKTVETSEKASYQNLLTEIKSAQNHVQKLNETQNVNIFEPENQSPLPATLPFSGSIQLPFGQRLITDQESDNETDYKYSSEGQTDKNDSVQKCDPGSPKTEEQDNMVSSKHDPYNNQMYSTI